MFESLTLLKVTFLALALPLSLPLPIVKSLPFLATISALSKLEIFRSSTNFNSLVLMVRLALFVGSELELSSSTPALIVICLVMLILSEEIVRLPSFCEILPPIWISVSLPLFVIFKSPLLLVIFPLIMLFLPILALVVIFKSPSLIMSRRFTTP
ncbi:hypothetical protein BV129_00927 [Haemophilus influenzae]|nr:hypothetical protein BV129_00927 [Haemophilus influenzae]